MDKLDLNYGAIWPPDGEKDRDLQGSLRAKVNQFVFLHANHKWTLQEANKAAGDIMEILLKSPQGE